MTAERGSRRRARSAEKLPAVIHEESLSTAGARSPEKNGISREYATTVARPTDPAPTAETKDLPSFLPNRMQSRNPASGSAGIHQSENRVLISPLQEVDLVDVDRFLVAEERHEDGQSDRGLGRGDRDDEEDEELALAGPERAAVADQGEVGGVHHDLDREEDGDRAAARERAREPHEEERRGGDEDVGERNRADHSAPSLCARTKAPTSAARSSTESASNGRRPLEKSILASGATSPEGDEAAGAAGAPWEEMIPRSEAAKTSRAAPLRKRWIGRGSRSRASSGTFKSIRTKRKRTRMAPA